MIERVVAVEIRQADVERRVARLETAETNLAQSLAKLTTVVAVVQTRVAIYAGIGSLLGGAAVAAVARLILGQ